MAVETGKKREPWVVDNQAAVARFFGVTIDTIKSWSRRQMPGERGTYDLSEIMRWRQREFVAHRKAVDHDGNGDTEESFSSARCRKEVALADRREIEAARLRGELVELHAVVADFNHAIATLRAHLDEGPFRLLGFLPVSADGDDKKRFQGGVRKWVDDAIEGVRQALLRWTGDESETETEPCQTNP